jgi:eukaryotic-like serine/threonine-protein kinase
MHRTRLLTGIVLIATATAAVVFALRTAVGDQARAQAALLAAASRDVASRDADERRATEGRVSAAAELQPLESAIRDRVDGATLLDLFDNEEWWRSYRAEFPLVRVVSGDRPLAVRGPDLGPAGDDLVRLARKQRLGSAVVPIGDRSYVVAAVRLSASPEREPVLLLGRPLPPVAAVPAPVAGLPRLGDHPALWGLAAALGLGGVGLVIAGRRRREAGVVPQPVTHEPTSKFGTPARPRAVVGSFTTPVTSFHARGPLTDGNAMSIPSPTSPQQPAVSLSKSSPSLPRHPIHASSIQLSPAVVPAEVGALFGRYRLVDRLGEGGMAELFIAEASGVEGFTRHFVLKRLRPELARDKEAVAQFIDEARLQAGLVHSNIVPVFDFGVVGGEYFMTQEYIVGRDLAKLVSRQSELGTEGLPEALAYYIAHETLQALAYAHERHDNTGSHMGIVHRDVSVGNVMVSLQGEVKLSDFGIVKSNRRVSKTQIGMVKGNANFMSPEQARGQTVDHRSDLFSLAHVLHYCLTGRLIYSGDNDLDVLYRAANGITAEDLAEIRKLPDPAGSVLEKALALDPAHRFQSASEFADALAAHIGSGKSGTSKLMQRLFGEELRRETTAAVG